MSIVNDHLHVLTDNIAIVTNFYGLRVRCVDIKGGNVLWQNNSITVPNVKPTVCKDLVIVVSNDRHLIALDKKTGNHVWTNKIGTKYLIPHKLLITLSTLVV